MIPRVTHTRLPEGRRQTKVRANVHVCAHKRQKNEDMTAGRDGTNVCVVEMKREPSAQGHPMKPTSLSRPGRPETYVKMYVKVHVHTKVGTNVRANEEKDEMTRHEDRRT